MQDIHRIEEGIRLIGDDAGDGRVNLNRQLLKCPRCDSINTKFCYYNNYNLSQPRHFCKGCRLYWTKGGILRTVPVGGGGSRKAKRYSPKRSSEKQKLMIIKSNFDSRLTAIPTATATEAGTSPTMNSTTNSIVSMESYLKTPAQTRNLHFQAAEFPVKCSDGELFSDISIFSELLPIGFTDFAGVTPFQLSYDHEAQYNPWHSRSLISMPEITAGFLDQTVEIDLPPSQNVEFRSFDCHEFGRPDMFDIPSFPYGNYWNDPLQSLPSVNSLSHYPFFNVNLQQ